MLLCLYPATLSENKKNLKIFGDFVFFSLGLLIFAPSKQSAPMLNLNTYNYEKAIFHSFVHLMCIVIIMHQ